MSTDTAPADKSAGTDQMYSDEDLIRISRSRPDPLGVDEVGREHYHATSIGPVGVSVVWAMSEAESVEHSEVLVEGSEQDLEAWIAFVESRCGWEICRYDDAPWGEWLADQLIGGDDA